MYLLGFILVELLLDRNIFSLSGFVHSFSLTKTGKLIENAIE